MAGLWVPPLLLSVACVAASCAGAGRSLADIFNAFRRAAADCVGQALAAGARTRHSTTMMIGAALAITGSLLFIRFSPLRFEVTNARFPFLSNLAFKNSP